MSDDFSVLYKAWEDVAVALVAHKANFLEFAHMTIVLQHALPDTHFNPDADIHHDDLALSLGLNMGIELRTLAKEPPFIRQLFEKAILRSNDEHTSFHMHLSLVAHDILKHAKDRKLVKGSIADGLTAAIPRAIADLRHELGLSGGPTG